MPNYKCLTQQEFANGEYKLIPIRFEDRYEIMKWRNEQIYHLRQKEPLTIEQQDAYFENVVSKLFDQVQPDQILFSFLKNEELIGYGGLVHINWVDRNAEVSFLTTNPKDLDLWKPYLELLKQVAFSEIDLHKIFTYAYDVRFDLYTILESSNFILEAVLSNNSLSLNFQQDVRIHSCFNYNRKLWRRQANLGDASLLFAWANDETVRAKSKNTDLITWQEHLEWFSDKLLQNKSRVFIYFNHIHAVGNLRLDLINKEDKISYLVDKAYRGRGFGDAIIKDAMEKSQRNLIADVKIENAASNKIFEKNGFNLVGSHKKINTWYYEK